MERRNWFFGGMFFYPLELNHPLVFDPGTVVDSNMLFTMDSGVWPLILAEADNMILCPSTDNASSCTSSGVMYALPRIKDNAWEALYKLSDPLGDAPRDRPECFLVSSTIDTIYSLTKSCT